MSRVEAIKQLNADLAPFRIVDSGKTFSLILTELNFKGDLFAPRANDGMEGNGYDWQSVATVVLSESDARLREAVNFDSESSMFCANGPFDELVAFARLFKEVVDNTDRFTAALSVAEPD